MDRDEKRAAKEAAKQERRAQASEQQARITEQYGTVSIQKTFYNRMIVIYSKGYVLVSKSVFNPKGEPERLLAIDYSADITKKTGLGRATAAVLTSGLNLLSSNKRGDAYLTIVTDKQTYSLRSEAPTAFDTKNGQALASTARAILGSTSLQDDESKAPAEDMAGQLAKLVELHKLGALSDEEFTAAKARIIG